MGIVAALISSNAEATWICPGKSLEREYFSAIRSRYEDKNGHLPSGFLEDVVGKCYVALNNYQLPKYDIKTKARNLEDAKKEAIWKVCIMVFRDHGTTLDLDSTGKNCKSPCPYWNIRENDRQIREKERRERTPSPDLSPRKTREKTRDL